MKHFLLLLVLMFSGYFLWSIADKGERSLAARFVGKHALRLVLLFVIALILLLAAVYAPSSSLI